MLFDSLTKDNYLMFAIKHYDNPQAEGKKEFYDDMKRFKYLKRLFKRYHTSGEMKSRLIINHMIILSNVFGTDAAKVLLLYKIDDIYWPVLKCFLKKLNMLSGNDLTHINYDKQTQELLGKI